jgi:hypothetical protein
MAGIKLQATEHKGVIWMVKAVFAVTDEGDEGAGLLIDMTKVTKSTPADKTLPQPLHGADQRDLEQGSDTINHASKGTKS